MACEFDQEWRILTLEHHSNWILVAGVQSLVNVLEVEELSEVRKHDLQVGLSESFSEADAFSATERGPAHRIALFAAWSKIERALRIEALGEELVRPLPFGGVLVKTPVEDSNPIACLHRELTSEVHILLEDYR